MTSVFPCFVAHTSDTDALELRHADCAAIILQSAESSSVETETPHVRARTVMSPVLGWNTLLPTAEQPKQRF
jgi:hypothetical protein